MSGPAPGRRLRAAIKSLALSVLYSSGMLWLLALARLRHRTVVLMYHRVLPENRQRDCYSSRGILVTPETFERHMAFLKRFMRPLAPAEFLQALRSGAPMPSRSCLVTFDDGWHDNLEFALPVLARYGVPAVLFVPVDHVGMLRGFWQERLARALHARRSDAEARRAVAAACGLEALDPAVLDNRDALLDIVARVKRLPLPEIDALLAQLESGNTAPHGGEDRFLDWDGLADVARSGVVNICSHAMSHRPLTRIPEAEVRGELSGSARALSDRLGVTPALLAYPNGDASPQVAAAAAGCGFQAAFTTERGHVAAGSDPFLLCRINMHESASRTRAAFFARLLGLT